MREKKTLSEHIWQDVDYKNHQHINVCYIKEFIETILKECCTLCEDDIKKRVGKELLKSSHNLCCTKEENQK